MDYSLTENKKGRPLVLAHRTDCPMVEKHRLEGKPIMTMFDCEEPLPKDIERHSCLTGKP